MGIPARVKMAFQASFEVSPSNLQNSFPLVISPPQSIKPLSPVEWGAAHNKTLCLAESGECRAVQAVVDSEIARDDSQYLSELQLKFSNNELGNRIQVTEELKQLLDGQLGVLSIEEAAVDNEMAELQKTVGEHEAGVALVAQLQQLRSKRPGSVRVLDSVDHQIKLYLRDLESSLYASRVKKLLSVQQQLHKLRAQMEQDVRRKGAAIQVDATVLESKQPSQAIKSLTAAATQQPSSRAIKPFDAVRVTPGRPRTANKTPKAWVASALKLLHDCQARVKAAGQVRKQTKDYRCSRNGIGGTAKSRLCDAINISILELTDRLTDLMAEALEIQKDLDADHAELEQLHTMIPELKGPLRMAEDRLRQRARRPMPERVRDSAEKALENEVQSLGLSLAKLRSKQKKLEGNRTRLSKLKTEIVQNVGYKQEAVAINQTCLDILHLDAIQLEDQTATTSVEQLSALLKSKFRTNGQLFYASDAVDDKITFKGFGRGVAMVGLQITPAATRQLFQTFDTNFDGYIEWQELQAKLA